MKKIVITLFLSFVTCTFSYGQSSEVCEKIVTLTYDAISKKNADPILPYLSEDFKIAGQSGKIAKMIIPQLFAQLNITDFKKIKENKTDVLTFEYETNFGEKGKQTSTFIFNKENQLQELELVKIEVKTMSGEAKVEKSIEASFTVPFKIKNNFILVTAEVNGIKRNFVIDNGSPKLIFNNKHKSNAQTITQTSNSNVQGVGGYINNMDINKVENFDFAGIQLKNQNVLSIDLTRLEKKLNTDIYGLIGYEIYKDYDLLFDYSKNELTFINPTKTDEYIKNHFKSSIEIPIELNKHIATVKGIINDKEYTFGIDCGAETNLINAELFVSLKNQLSKLRKDNLRGADKKETKVNSGNINSIKIGTINFSNTKTVFGDISQLNKAYDLNADGLIGYEILSKQPTLLSYINKKLLFLQ